MPQEPHQGFSEDDLKPAPPAYQVAARLKEQQILEDYAAGGIKRVMSGGDFPTSKAAKIAIRRALRALDRRMVDGAPEVRAALLLELQQLGSDLPAEGDHRKTAERRLLNESVRRLYGLDLQREPAGADGVSFVIDVRLPGERDGATDPPVEGEWTEGEPAAELEAGDDGDEEGE